MLGKEIKAKAEMGGNLKKEFKKGLKIAENLHQSWVSADYLSKQKLQYLVFPDGMMYDKVNNRVLTSRINTIFHEISIQTRVLAEKQKDNLLQDCLFGSNVGMDTASTNILMHDVFVILKE